VGEFSAPKYLRNLDEIYSIIGKVWIGKGK